MSRTLLKEMIERYQNTVDEEDEVEELPRETCPVSEMELLTLYQTETSTRKGLRHFGANQKLLPLRLIEGDTKTGFVITNDGKAFLDKWFDRQKLRAKRFRRGKWR